MKKKLVLSLICILIFGIFYFYNLNTNTLNTNIDNIKYAIVVDGIETNDIPSKGLYNVVVDCENATGKWLYNEWKLQLIELNNEKAICSLTFTTKDKKYLNNYITSLAGKTQGDGMVIDEIGSNPVYSSSTALAESDYTVVSMYTSENGSSDESGTNVTDAFTFNGTNWSISTDYMTKGVYYHLGLNVPDNGYYQVCYNISSGHSSNRLRIFRGGVLAPLGEELYDTYIAASTTESKSDCYDLGYITSSELVKVAYRAYSDSSYPIASLSFNLQKASGSSNFSAGIRYEGKNPNNYVKFNNELWRIIGVFDENTHGHTGEKLIKIVRDDTIGAVVWNKDNIGNWANSNLRKILNSSYYNYNVNGYDANNCFLVSDTIEGKCDYSNNGINDYFRPMIKKSTWHLRGMDWASYIVDEMYNIERTTGLIFYSNYSYTVEDFIGLLYPSDYGYSSLETDCARTTDLNYYDSNSCAGKNWLFKYTYFSFITTDFYDNTCYYLNHDGWISQNNCENSYTILPTLYLDSSVYIQDGDGSITNPYILDM